MNFMKTFFAALVAFVVGSVVSFFIWIIILVGIGASSMVSTPVLVSDNTILKLDLSYFIEDSPVVDKFSANDLLSMDVVSKSSLFNILRAIEVAKSDDNIEGIYIRLVGKGGISGSAGMEEIRHALVDFKSSGKFIVAYNETYSQGGYYLASVADEVYLHPEGGMEWTGFTFNGMYYKGLMDKLDIEVEIFRPTACKYKSAVEPFFLTKMSDENRAQMQGLVNSMWSVITDGVSESRGISVDKLNQLADNLDVMNPEDAVKYGLVDSLIYEDGLEDIFASKGVEAGFDGEYNFVSLGQYASQVTVDNFSESQVAVVYADGSIKDGTGSGKTIYGNSLAKTIREVRENDDVKAVVLRVNSPGGSALASDIIWREMELLKAVKPVVVSMANAAASGGYYIAAPADVILADRMTITGSIGVFGMMMNTAGALESKLGITMDGVKSNKHAGMGQMGVLTKVERAAIMRSVDKVYERFTSLVAQGRNLPIEKVYEIAQGRVWSGDDAVSIGLVDAIGGLKMAIAQAADKANLGADFQVVEVIEELTGFDAIMHELTTGVQGYFEMSKLGVMFEDYKMVEEITSMQGVVMYDARVANMK